MTARSEAEVQQYRISREIHVTGEGVPKPVTTFEEASFPEYVLAEIQRAGFTQPSPIQAQGWPMALLGRDLVGIAETGSGKTLAYLLPGVVHINAQASASGWLADWLAGSGVVCIRGVKRRCVAGSNCRQLLLCPLLLRHLLRPRSRWTPSLPCCMQL